MRGAAQFLLAPFLVLAFGLRCVGKNRQLPNVFQRVLEKLAGLLDGYLRLPCFCLANGVKPASEQFFSSQDRERLLCNRN